VIEGMGLRTDNVICTLRQGDGEGFSQELGRHSATPVVSPVGPIVFGLPRSA
jgi:hypothetical protein